jgi:AAHS family 4-hydroxybenzoate transporter-like MFS transporter
VKEKSAIGVISPTLRGGYRDVVPDLLYGPADFPLTSWLPLLIRETGASMSQASIITPVPAGGGIGVLILRA